MEVLQARKNTNKRNGKSDTVIITFATARSKDNSKPKPTHKKQGIFDCGGIPETCKGNVWDTAAFAFGSYYKVSWHPTYAKGLGFQFP